MGDEYNVLHCDYTVEETEEYLKKLVNKQYSSEQVQQILKALDLAYSAHANQIRSNDQPYILHPMRVALMLLKFDNDSISKVFIAALLHDTVEKTNITLSQVEEQFGKYVAKLVRSVTRKHDEMQSPQEKTEAKYRNWLEIMSGSHEVRMIKVCEDLENMVCWKSIPESYPDRKKIPRWLVEAQDMSLPLAETTNWKAYSVMCQEYQYYVERGLANHIVTL